MNGDQFRALLWLRWQLTRNQWRRTGQINAVITLAAVGIGLCAGVAGGVGGVLVGARLLPEASALTVQWVWDGLVGTFLLFWTIGVVSELQRAELIDLGRLLHLPVSLRDVFYLNYLASHFSLTVAVVLPAMLGLAGGLLVGRGPWFLLLVPLVLAFLFMITAWTYCLRGWLAALMINPRRRRAILVGITLAFVMVFQLPNLLTNVWMRRSPSKRGTPPATAEERMARDLERQAQMLRALNLAHQGLPFLWLPNGARGLAEGRFGPALWGGLGMMALGVWGLRRAFRTTVRFHRGEHAQQATPVARPSVPSRWPGSRLLVERRLPWLPDPVAALALASFRSLSRAPEFKMAMVMNLFIFGMIGAGIFLRGSTEIGATGRRFIASASVAVTFMGLIQVLCNQFGFDRDGFRTLVLSPVRRTQVLAGKNLALLPFALGIFLVVLGLMSVLTHLSVGLAISACLQFGAAFLALAVLGNVFSMLVPYHIAPGSLKATKTKATTMLLMVLVQMLVPLALMPIFLPAGLGLLSQHLGWLPAMPVMMISSVLLAGAAGVLYGLTLQPLGRMFARRELKILQVVTQQVE